LAAVFEGDISAPLWTPGYDGSFTTPDCHEEIKWLLAVAVGVQGRVLDGR